MNAQITEGDNFFGTEITVDPLWTNFISTYFWSNTQNVLVLKLVCNGNIRNIYVTALMQACLLNYHLLALTYKVNYICVLFVCLSVIYTVLHYCFIDILGYIYVYMHARARAQFGSTGRPALLLWVCPFIRRSTAWISNLFKAKGQNCYGGMVHGPHVEKKITVSGICKCLNYCKIVVVVTEFTSGWRPQNTTWRGARWKLYHFVWECAQCYIFSLATRGSVILVACPEPRSGFSKIKKHMSVESIFWLSYLYTVSGHTVRYC